MLNPNKMWEGTWSGGSKNNRFTLAAIQFTIFHVLIYKSDIVLVILCGCEIWSHASREEIRL